MLNYILPYYYFVLHYHMSKKHVFLSFRTTVNNQKHLKSIKSKYNMSIGDIIHRMIGHFADSGNEKDTIDKLFK